MAKLSPEALAYSAAALQSHDLKEALAVRNREHQQNKGTFDDSISRTMDFILTRTPSILVDCPQEVLEPLRVAAAMMELWGLNNIRQFVTIEGELDYRFSTDAIAYLLHSHGSFIRSLQDMRDAGITHVKLLGSNDSEDCEACRAADGAAFTIDTVPELPLAACQCRSKYGCRMIVIADDRASNK